MWNCEAPNKKSGIDVSENKIRIDATIPFQSLGNNYSYWDHCDDCHGLGDWDD